MKQTTTSNQHEQEKAGTLSVPAKKVGLMLEKVIQTEPSTGIVRDCFNLQPTALKKSACKNSTESAVNSATTSATTDVTRDLARGQCFYVRTQGVALLQTNKCIGKKVLLGVTEVINEMHN